MPIRVAVSPRAWMMNGEATWNAPSAAAPLMRELGCVECFLLVRDQRQRLHRRIAEPVAGGGRGACDLLDRGVEFRDMRHARLVPPPFHRPPSDARAIGHGADALKLEQGTSDGH